MNHAMFFLPETDEIRQKASKEMALCLYLHLKAELKKSEKLLSNITAEGITFEQHTKDMMGVLEAHFPGIAEETPFETEGYSANIIEDWWENSARKVGNRDSYQNSTFKFVNAITLERILYAQNPSEMTRQKLVDSIVDNMIKTRIIERGLTFPYLLSIFSYISRLELRRFERLGFEPIDGYKTLIERLDNAELSCLFKYYYDLAQDALQKSDSLLRNILPDSIADQLKENQTPSPIYFPSATVVFTDFVGFSRTASDMDPTLLVERLDRHFRAYDDIIAAHELEKLKTIGDSYMFAGGIPEHSNDHALRCISAALQIRDYVREQTEKENDPWSVRIGIHTGPLVAGIVGHKKFSYDIWGDTVNVASRMESSGEKNHVNISAYTHSLVKDRIIANDLGERTVKNRGEIRMYTVEKLIGELL